MSKSVIRKGLEILCRARSLWSRPESKPEQNDATLARLRDTDPVYRALMDAAFEQLGTDVMTAIRPGLSAEERAFSCGKANGMAQYLMGVENWRAGAVKDAVERMKSKV